MGVFGDPNESGISDVKVNSGKSNLRGNFGDPDVRGGGENSGDPDLRRRVSWDHDVKGDYSGDTDDRRRTLRTLM